MFILCTQRIDLAIRRYVAIRRLHPTGALSPTEA